jgi:hypothetical protein
VPGFAAEGDLATPMVPPTGLAVAMEPDGTPAFRLFALRALPPAVGLGRLDLRLRLLTPPEAAPVPAVRGWLRLRPAAALGAMPPELLAPIPLDWNGIGMARLALPLSADGATLLEALLRSGDTPGLGALVELELDGIAPRLPRVAHVSVPALLAALRALANAEALVRRDALLAHLAADPAAFGITVTGEAVDHLPGALALALLDRLRARLLEPAPSPAADGAPVLRLPAAAEALPERMEWDLTERLVAPRPLVLSLDPLEAARALAASGGVDRLVVHATAAPLSLGFHRVVLDANLPVHIAGLLSLGARFSVPAHPPARPQAIERDIEIAPGAAPVVLPLRLAPGEPLAWTLQGFAFLADGREVERLQADPVTGAGERTTLTPALLPLRFLDVEAEPTVLALGRITVTLSADRPGRPFRLEVTLSVERPGLALAMPRDVTQAKLAATLHGTDTALALPARDAADWSIAPRDLPGFGARERRVELRLPPAASLAALDLLPEDAAADAEPVTLAFTAAEPVRAFRWVCRDPFRPGLRWRRHAPGAAWSEPERGPGPLLIQLEDAA